MDIHKFENSWLKYWWNPLFYNQPESPFSYDLWASFLSLPMNFPERSLLYLDSPLNILSAFTSFLSKQSMTLISHELSLRVIIMVLMDNEPSSCMHIITCSWGYFFSEFNSYSSWWQDVDSSRHSILNDQSLFLSLGDNSWKRCKIL